MPLATAGRAFAAVVGALFVVAYLLVVAWGLCLAWDLVAVVGLLGTLLNGLGVFVCLAGTPRARAALRRRAVACTLLNGGCLAVIAWVVPQDYRLQRHWPPYHTQLLNRLKTVALAMAEYEQAHCTLPPAAVYDPGGRPLLSWRVLLLPYLEQEVLYRQFRLNEPWDSLHNRTLLSQKPDVYALPGPNSPPEPFLTCCQVLVGEDTVFAGRQGAPLADIKNGVGRTLLVVEAAQAVPWTQPADLPYAADRPLPELGGHFGNAFCAALVDGTVRRIERAWVSRRSVRSLRAREGTGRRCFGERHAWGPRADELLRDTLPVRGSYPYRGRRHVRPPPRGGGLRAGLVSASRVGRLGVH
jgi:hypothetical protein